MYIQLNGQILYYEKYGEGQPFLLVHGNGETHEIFDVLIPELAEHYTVYAIDSRGHGLSASPKELHYMDMADDMAAFIDALELKAPLFYGVRFAPLIISLESLSGYFEAKRSPTIPPSLKP